MEETKVSTETKSSNKVYEVGFHIIPSVPQEKLGEEFSSIKENLDKNGAVVISEEMPKYKNLTYEMRKDFGGKYEKYNQAYFGWVKFEAGSEGVLAIDKYFKTSPVILRHLLVKTVRENTMTAPKAPSYRRGEASKGEVVAEEAKVEKKEVSETELDKAIDAVIAE
jgi:ribosomal protein S6